MRQIASYEHNDKERANNPPAGLVSSQSDPDGPAKTYAYDPHLDPQLVWAGKAEHTSFAVPTVSLHVHERIDPRTILDAARRAPDPGAASQLSLFGATRENPPLRQAIEFYRHRHGWSNRLIAGDSLLVMNSLLEKEGLAGQVQMIYIDPPYGIKYGSNFQPFVNKRDVKDGKDDDLTAEPEQIRAFRDTWELGLHSYLTYLRDRLLLSHALLRSEGSVFVQIGDANVHHIREILDEVFGSENFIGQIAFRKTAGQSSSFLAMVADYLLWYGKDAKKTAYRQPYIEKLPQGEGGSIYSWVELRDGTKRRLSIEEQVSPEEVPQGARIFALSPLTSSGFRQNTSIPFHYDGRTYDPTSAYNWKTSLQGLEKLGVASRLFAVGNKLWYVRYLDDFPVVPLTNVWTDVAQSFQQLDYVVQTNAKVVQRCILMTTDPGDLVFDPTCGSGTTATVAEQWGRRWITCDTSRVAVALAKQRLMTAAFDYYDLARPEEGVGSGFRYKTVPHVTLKSIANNPDIREGLSRAQIDAAIARHAPQETLYDQPFVDRSKARVTGPFTVEAVPSPVVKPLDDGQEPVVSGQWSVDSGEGGAPALAPGPLPLAPSRSGETLRQAEWRDELFRAGIRGKGGQRIAFARLEPLAGTRYLHAEGETKRVDSGEGLVDSKKSSDSSLSTSPYPLSTIRVVVSFGPEHAPLEQRQVESVLFEAEQLRPKPRLLVFAAFQFDPEAAKDIDETNWPGVTLLKVQMAPDLFTDDLKKKRSSNESFWLIGQPDVVVDSEEWIVDSEERRIAPYDIVAELSGAHSLAEINGLSREDLSLYAAIAERRDLWAAVASDAGSGVDSGQHRRGPGAARDGGVPALSGRGPGVVGRIGDAADFVRELGLLSAARRRELVDRLRRDRAIADRAGEILEKVNSGEGIVDSRKARSSLSTIHYSQVTLHGFDYFNTKTGEIESGGADKIAMWLLDTDYDGRSLFPRQVFFPLAGEKEGWARLARNLKAEIDEELIEAYRGTLSLPFAAGPHRRAAVKIIDDRGIESLKIVELG